MNQNTSSLGIAGLEELNLTLLGQSAKMGLTGLLQIERYSTTQKPNCVSNVISMTRMPN